MRGSLKSTARNQFRSPFQSAFSIHLKQPRRGATSGGATPEANSIQDETFFPTLAARMEQRNDRLCVRIHAAQVRAFVPIAAVTGPREVLGSCRAAMLARDNVCQVKRFERWKPVRQATILASTAGPLTNGSAQRFAHFAGAADASWRSAFKRRVAIMSPSSMKRSYSLASSGVSWPSLALFASKSVRIFAASLRCISPRARTLCESRQRAADSSRLSSTPSSIAPCAMAQSYSIRSGKQDGVATRILRSRHPDCYAIVWAVLPYENDGHYRRHHDRVHRLGGEFTLHSR
jgi:hypothetical protein